MNRKSASIYSILLIALTLLAVPRITNPVSAPFLTPPVAVGIWSTACGSSNITSTNPSCPSLAVGNTVSVQINVTNIQCCDTTGSFNNFVLTLYYDPAILSPTTVDFTGTIWPTPQNTKMQVLSQKVTAPGVMNIAAVCLGCTNTAQNGPFVNVNFQILTTGVSPISLAAGIAPNSGSTFTQLVVAYPDKSFHNYGPDTYDGYFMNQQVHRGPVAKFTYSPSSPRQGNVISFDASASNDLDATNGIKQYVWDFGDGFSISTAAAVYSYRYVGQGVSNVQFAGNFSVLLTVIDTDDSFQGMQVQRLYIAPNPFHDVIAQSVAASPSQATPGDKVGVNVIIFNNGTFPETYKLRVSYGPPTTIFSTANNQNITAGATGSTSFTLDTTGLAPGFYTITANITVLSSSSNPMGIENIPRNNVATTVLQIGGQTPPSSSPLLIVGGIIAAVAVVGTLTVFLRRRRRKSAPL